MKSQSPCLLLRRSRVAKPELRVLGLDPSLSSTGYAYRESNGSVATGRVTTDDLRGAWRLHYIRAQVGKILDSVQPAVVAYEDYAMGGHGNVKSQFAQAELGGILKTLIWERGIDYLCIPPTSMKSVIALNGSAKKGGISTALRIRFGIDVVQNDEADAAGLLLFGEMHAGITPHALPTAELRRLKTINECAIVRGRLQPARRA